MFVRPAMPSDEVIAVAEADTRDIPSSNFAPV